VNSRLYSEKAYVLSRNFVRRALEVPIGGLEREVEWLYFTHKKLARVVRDARKLIDASRANVDESATAASSAPPAKETPAVPRLSEGGMITLERILTKLETILAARGGDAA
jgi:ubiquitin-conjugating enzyme E2 O